MYDTYLGNGSVADKNNFVHWKDYFSVFYTCKLTEE